MSRTKKIVLGVIAAVVVLVIVALAAVSLLLNPNAYKDRIASAAESAIGRKVHIEGDLSLSVFPSVVIGTGAIRVENPAEFGGGDFVSLKQADLRLELMPLISGKVRIDKVTATDMTVLLVKDKTGRANWEFKSEAPPAETPPAETPVEAPSPAAGNSSPQGMDIAISSLELINADITYRDLAQGTAYQVKQLNFQGDNLKPGEDFSLAVSGLIVATKEALSAGFKVETAGSVNPLTLTGALSSVSLEVNAEGKGVPGGKATLDFKGALDASQGLKLMVLTIDSLKAEAMNTTVDMAGKAEIPQDYRQTRLNVSHLDAQGFDGKLSFKGDVSPLAMSGKGEINVTASIKKALAALGSPLQTQNPAALEKFELSSPVELSPASGINLSNLSGSLDSTKFSGNLAFNPGEALGGKGKGMSVHSTIKLDAINVDDYLPVKGPGPAPAQASEKAPGGQSAGNASGGKPAAGGKSAQPSALASLNGKINFNVGRLTASKVVVSDLNGVLAMNNGQFDLNPCTFSVFKGNVNASAKANMAQKPMPLALNTTVKGLSVGDVMQFVSGDQKVTGTADLNLNVTGAGDAWPSISKTLAGSGSVSVRDGLIRQIKLVPDSAAQVGIAGVAPLKPLDGKLESMTATFNGSKGRFTNNDLMVVASIANIAGQGWVDLGQNAIDYNLMVATGGYNVPVVVTGSLTSPKSGIDAQKFLKANAGQMLNDAQTIQDLKDPEKTKELLRGVLGGGSSSGSSGSGAGTTGGKGSGSGSGGGKSLEQQGKEILNDLFN